jgi:simple sugar transport system permease protein
MATTVVRRELIAVSPTRQRVMGIFFLLLAAGIVFLFSRETSEGIITTFRLTPGGAGVVEVPDWRLPSLATLNTLAILCAVIGGVQLARGFGKATNWMLGAVTAFFVFGFLVWAAADKSLNLAGMLETTVTRAVPLTLGALSGVLCERAGVVNIAIEGMMLGGAMTGALVASVTHNQWVGLASAIAIGALLGLVHGVLSIKYKVNQIVSGTVINILMTGVTSYISAKFLNVYQELNNPGLFPQWSIPGLSRIPIIGGVLFSGNLFLFATFIFLFVLQVALFSTRWGLRLRSVGEHPKAADTLGINVFRTRYMAVILGGMMASFAGAYITQGSVGRFDEVMTAGRGFISLAAMIFGNWNPLGSFGASLIFGFAESLASKLAILGLTIPSEFLGMAPYLATMAVLAGVVGRGQMPAADGTPYEKEEL